MYRRQKPEQPRDSQQWDQQHACPDAKSGSEGKIRFIVEVISVTLLLEEDPNSQRVVSTCFNRYYDCLQHRYSLFVRKIVR